MRLPGSAELLEDRRRRALKLLDEGRSLNEVARLIDCAPSSVMLWRNKRRRNGEKGLKVRFSPGRPHKLAPARCRVLLRLLLKGAMASGYSTQLWTTARIAQVIRKKFRVEYHPGSRGSPDASFGVEPPEATEKGPGAGRWEDPALPTGRMAACKKNAARLGPTSSLSTNRASS